MTAYGHDTERKTAEAAIMSELDMLRKRAMEPGTLPRSVKELIALGVALRGGNDTSIAYHVHNAIEAGCSKEEISETVDIAAVVAGEAVAVNAVQVQKALSDNGDEGGLARDASFREFARGYDE
jgi:AhpD family alkylhydroperoxidase